MKNVVITCQSDGYRASIDEDPSVFGSGWDIREAIGDLVIAHPDLFDCVLTRRHARTQERDESAIGSPIATTIR